MTEIAWSQLPDTGQRDRPAAMTIGVFDGLHTGHQALLSAATRDAELLPVVVTFARHPSEVLAPGSFPGFIMSRAQKRETLRASGVGAIVLIDFSVEFSQMPGTAFLDRLLDSFDLRFAAIGYDFRCGGEMSMDANAVREFLIGRGTDVELIGAVRDSNGVISSTRVRESIRAGLMDDAARLLGRPFTLDLSDEVAGSDAGQVSFELDKRRLLPVSRQLVPPQGEYPVVVITDETREPAILTVDENSIRLPLAPETRIRYIVLQENRVL